ncbi:MAG: hypothetical protein ACHQF2_05180 [Flavobacteriales bacterium]
MRKGRNIVLSTWGAFVFLLVGGKLEAQPYPNAVGVRFGESSGLTLKTFAGSGAFDFIISVWPNDLAVFALYERYHPLGDNGLNLYYGGGVHVAFNTIRNDEYRYRHEYYEKWWYHQRNGFGFGLDAIVGLEYKLENAPVAFSIELKPYMEINRIGNVFVSPDPGVGVKFTF